MIKEEMKDLKYYLVFLGILLSLFVYAQATGWRFFSSNYEKWAPEQHKGYHK